MPSPKSKHTLSWERLPAPDGRLAICLPKDVEASLRAGELFTSDSGKSAAPVAITVNPLRMTGGPDGMREYKTPLNPYIKLDGAGDVAETF